MTPLGQVILGLLSKNSLEANPAFVKDEQGNYPQGVLPFKSNRNWAADVMGLPNYAQEANARYLPSSALSTQEEAQREQLLKNSQSILTQSIQDRAKQLYGNDPEALKMFKEFGWENVINQGLQKAHELTTKSKVEQAGAEGILPFAKPTAVQKGETGLAEARTGTISAESVLNALRQNSDLPGQVNIAQLNRAFTPQPIGENIYMNPYDRSISQITPPKVAGSFGVIGQNPDGTPKLGLLPRSFPGAIMRMGGVGPQKRIAPPGTFSSNNVPSFTDVGNAAIGSGVSQSSAVSPSPVPTAATPFMGRSGLIPRLLSQSTSAGMNSPLTGGGAFNVRPGDNMGAQDPTAVWGNLLKYLIGQ